MESNANSSPAYCIVCNSHPIQPSSSGIVRDDEGGTREGPDISVAIPAKEEVTEVCVCVCVRVCMCVCACMCVYIAVKQVMTYL